MQGSGKKPIKRSMNGVTHRQDIRRSNPVQRPATATHPHAQPKTSQPQPNPQPKPQTITDTAIPKPLKTKRKKDSKTIKRAIIAFVCAAACIFALVCFIKLNIPTISVHVAAMQAGIEASYPSYIPRDFTLSSVNSDGNQVIMVFKNGDQNFTITEEKSSWDSSALLNNFVKPEWKENYSVAREQGITIYVSGSNATWVNGGLRYRIIADDNTLSKKQIYSIATSL